MRLSILIPSFEGAKRLDDLIPLLRRALVEYDREWECVIVDDGSGDANWRSIEKLCRKNREVNALGLRENRGQQVATLTGLTSCRGMYIVTMDDDLEQRPEEIPQLLGKLEEGFDLVYGVRPLAYGSLLRRLGGRLRDLLFRCLLRVPAGVRLSSFRAMRRQLVDRILTGPCPYPYLSAMALGLNPAAASLKFDPTERRLGRQNLRRLILTLIRIAWAYGTPGSIRAKPFAPPPISRRCGEAHE